MVTLTPCSSPRWHMMERGEQRLAVLPLGSAPASSSASATDQCWFTRATNSGVCPFTSTVSTVAPCSRSREEHSRWPAGGGQGWCGVVVVCQPWCDWWWW